MEENIGTADGREQPLCLGLKELIQEQNGLGSILPLPTHQAEIQILVRV